MTPIEKQILKNQKIILRYLWLKDNNYTSADGTLLIETANETDKLLNNKKKSRKEQAKEFIDKIMHETEEFAKGKSEGKE